MSGVWKAWVLLDADSKEEAVAELDRVVQKAIEEDGTVGEVFEFDEEAE